MQSYISQLVNYIKKNLKKGYTLESLKWALMSQGYSRSEIDRAIRIANEELAKKAPLLKEKPVIKFEVEPILKEKEEEQRQTKKGKVKHLLKSIKEVFKS